MRSLTVICATRRGSPNYRIVEPSHIAGSPLVRWRRGDDGVLQCLIDVYGMSPEAACVVVLEAKTSGSANITID